MINSCEVFSHPNTILVNKTKSFVILVHGPITPFSLSREKMLSQVVGYREGVSIRRVPGGGGAEETQKSNYITSLQTEKGFSLTSSDKRAISTNDIHLGVCP